MIQQGLNQLLTSTAYFMQPIGERRRDKKAFKMAQEEADKRVEAIIETAGEQTGTDEQIEYAANLQSNAAKAKFERNPTEETFKEWKSASATKEEIIGNIEEDRREKAEKEKEANWRKNAIKQIEQDINFEKLKRRLRKEAGLD